MMSKTGLFITILINIIIFAEAGDYISPCDYCTEYYYGKECAKYYYGSYYCKSTYDGYCDHGYEYCPPTPIDTIDPVASPTPSPTTDCTMANCIGGCLDVITGVCTPFIDDECDSSLLLCPEPSTDPDPTNFPTPSPTGVTSSPSTSPTGSTPPPVASPTQSPTGSTPPPVTAPTKATQPPTKICDKDCTPETAGKPCIHTGVGNFLCFDFMDIGGCPPDTVDCSIPMDCDSCTSILRCLHDNDNSCLPLNAFGLCPTGSTLCPSVAPSVSPTKSPTTPTEDPTKSPSKSPAVLPTLMPSKSPVTTTTIIPDGCDNCMGMNMCLNPVSGVCGPLLGGICVPGTILCPTLAPTKATIDPSYSPTMTTPEPTKVTNEPSVSPITDPCSDCDTCITDDGACIPIACSTPGGCFCIDSTPCFTSPPTSVTPPPTRAICADCDLSEPCAHLIDGTCFPINALGECPQGTFACFTPEPTLATETPTGSPSVSPIIEPTISPTEETPSPTLSPTFDCLMTADGNPCELINTPCLDVNTGECSATIGSMNSCAPGLTNCRPADFPTPPPTDVTTTPTTSPTSGTMPPTTICEKPCTPETAGLPCKHEAPGNYLCFAYLNGAGSCPQGTIDCGRMGCDLCSTQFPCLHSTESDESCLRTLPNGECAQGTMLCPTVAPTTKPSPMPTSFTFPPTTVTIPPATSLTPSPSASPTSVTTPPSASPTDSPTTPQQACAMGFCPNGNNICLDLTTGICSPETPLGCGPLINCRISDPVDSLPPTSATTLPSTSPTEKPVEICDKCPEYKPCYSYYYNKCLPYAYGHTCNNGYEYCYYNYYDAKLEGKLNEIQKESDMNKQMITLTLIMSGLVSFIVGILCLASVLFIAHRLNCTKKCCRTKHGFTRIDTDDSQYTTDIVHQAAV